MLFAHHHHVRLIFGLTKVFIFGQRRDFFVLSLCCTAFSIKPLSTLLPHSQALLFFILSHLLILGFAALRRLCFSLSPYADFFFSLLQHRLFHQISLRVSYSSSATAPKPFLAPLSILYFTRQNQIKRDGYYRDGLRGCQWRPVRRFVASSKRVDVRACLLFITVYLNNTPSNSPAALYTQHLPVTRSTRPIVSIRLAHIANRPVLDEAPRYERDNRSASPRPRDDNEGSRRRSASPGGHGDRFVAMSLTSSINTDIYIHNSNMKDVSASRDDDDGAINPGSNLFVTGIHPKLSEAEVSKMFEKYGDVEKCQIMRDPHTKESRGFGFVKMVTSEQAEAAKEGLQGEQIEGRTLSIEKARRARPRTPTPGKYFGPPKRGKESQ